MTLKDLNIGHVATVAAVNGSGALRQHLLDMGMIPGTEVHLVKYAPLGDPMELIVHGYSLTLRLADAAQIDITGVRPYEKPNSDSTLSATQNTVFQTHHHPGLGEAGRFHCKRDEHPLPKSQTITFALVGNQNCGKTTLFNKLTGANQHVGNFPGVTVEQKNGAIKGHPDTLVTDLPGIYSLSPFSQEEIVSRDFIINEKPNCIINIVDATNIERNLYLTMQLLELDVPVVVALNMMDEIENNHGTIRINAMEELLGVPVIAISAAKGEGVEELVEHAMHIARFQEKPLRQDFCSPEEHGGAVHRCLHAIMHLIEDHSLESGIPLRFAANKLIEGDHLVIEALKLSKNELATVRHILKQLQEERNLDAAAAVADMRFNFISNLCQRTVVKPAESKERRRSRHIDAILTGKWTALPAFSLIMALTFFLSFNVIGFPLQDWLSAGIDWFTAVSDNALTRWNVDSAVHSLVIEGVYAGVGSVLSFLPIILALFFFLSMLEDSGYMARIAFVMDKALRRLGLSGRSIVPLLIGFGCSVPSIMASRTLPSERDRRLTVILTPFMSCTAKLPIYAFFTAIFFPGNAATVMIALYGIGIIVGIAVALIFKKTLFRGEAVPFVMELPNYRLPAASNVAHLLWDKARDFLQRAFTVIFAATIVIWFLQTFTFHFQMAPDSQDSMLAVIAGHISPIFSPLGFDDWRITTSLLSGFMAKESVVSTLGVLFGSEASLIATLSVASAWALLVFCLLYTPCVAAIASVKRELGGYYAIAVVIGQCLVAWLVAYLTYTIVSALM